MSAKIIDMHDWLWNRPEQRYWNSAAAEWQGAIRELSVLPAEQVDEFCALWLKAFNDAVDEGTRRQLDNLEKNDA